MPANSAALRRLVQRLRFERVSGRWQSAALRSLGPVDSEQGPCPTDQQPSGMDRGPGPSFRHEVPLAHFFQAADKFFRTTGGSDAKPFAFFRIQEGSEFSCRNVDDRGAGPVALEDRALVAKEGSRVSRVRGEATAVVEVDTVEVGAAGPLRQVPAPWAWTARACVLPSPSPR
jgi:hypothetical protein